MKHWKYIGSFIAFLLIFHGIVFSQTNPDAIVSGNLGENINTAATDFGAFVEANGLTMYFVSRRVHNGSMKDNFWVTNRISLDSPWSKPEFLKALNNESSVGGITLDDSGRIYFASNGNSSGPNDVNIWEGIIHGKTMDVRKLPAPINSELWETQPSITADGNELYFVSNRKSLSKKSVNILVSHRQKDNSWSSPEMLSSQINFGSYNASPFISPNGNYLFFCSNGITEMGRNIYMSHKENGDWSKPLLIPGFINKEGNNIFPMIPRSADVIYFASDRSGGYGDYDIYQMKLPKEIHDQIVSSFK